MANRILVDADESISAPSWIASVEPFMQKVMKFLAIDNTEVSVLFCSDAFIAELNKQYRSVEGPTDVLSFEDGESYEEDGVAWKEAGDIVISVEMLPKNAVYFEVDQDEELKRLLVHGMLHLNGMDHGEEHVEKGVEPVCEMLKLQKKILAALSAEKLIG